MKKYIFAVIFILLAWAAVTVFELPSWWATLTTVVILVSLALWVGLRFVFAMVRSKRLEAGLAKAMEPSDGLRPEVRAQIEEMRTEFEKALGTLKRSKVAKGGKVALAALPWYVIIGPPGSGKSTLLRNSGLKFPYLTAKRGAVRGGAGTRNCDWWLANEGILLDTAGRWTTEEDDQEEWLAFLDLLKRTRKGRALNGILLSLGADELINTDPEDIVPLAKKLRERIDEVLTRLSVRLPVYVLITKCDLIGGFVETFGSLNEKDRGQLWGLTLPLDAPAADRPEMFVERLDRLVNVLETRAYSGLKRENRPEIARKVYEFPQQFEGICANLVDLVNEVFTENVYQDSPLLRGVYFTSATQEGRPIDKLVDRVAKQIGLSVHADYQPVLKAKSYFLRDMFRGVVFPDQNVAVEGEGAIKRRRLINMAAAGGAFAAAGAVALMPIMAYSRNVALGGSVEEFAKALVQSRGAEGQAPKPGPELEDQFETSRALLEQRQHGALSMTFGFYQGDKLYPELARVVRDHLVRPVLFRDRDVMSAFAARRNASAFDDARSALRLHLLATGPKQAGEPTPDARNWNEVMDEGRGLLVKRWKGHLAGRRVPTTPRSEQVIGDATMLYLLGATDDKALWEARDFGAIDRVREPLCKVAQGDPIAQITSRTAVFEPLDVTLQGVLGGSSILFRKQAKVPGAFTQAGWNAPTGVYAQLLAKQAGAGNEGAADWSLGGCDLLTVENIAEHRRRYLGLYESAWKSFLADIYPKEGSDLLDAAHVFRRYVEDRPLLVLWRSMEENMPLAPKSGLVAAAESSIDKVRGALGGGKKKQQQPSLEDTIDPRDADLRAVDKTFARLLNFGKARKDGKSPLDTYYEMLGPTVKAVKAFEESKDPAGLNAEVKRIRADVEESISTHEAAAEWGPTLRRLLLTPLEGLRGTIVDTDHDTANTRWCDAVVTPFQQTLADKYPFSANGIDAPLDLVAKFFHPKAGVLWQHYDKVLAADFEPGTYNPRVGANVAYARSLTKYLKSAKAATDLLFAGGGDLPSIPLQARIATAGTAVEEIALNTGTAAKLRQRNDGERFLPLTWPTPEATLAVRGERGSIVIPTNLPFNGDWSLFHLIDLAQQSPGSDARQEFLTTVWEGNLGAGKITVKIDWKPKNLRSALYGLAPPRAITGRRSPCGG